MSVWCPNQDIGRRLRLTCKVLEPDISLLITDRILFRRSREFFYQTGGVM